MRRRGASTAVALIAAVLAGCTSAASSRPSGSRTSRAQTAAASPLGAGTAHASTPRSSSRLAKQLAEIDDAWRAHGYPIAEYLRAGAAERHVREVLAPLSSTPCRDLVTWFTWHDGFVDPTPSFGAYPVTYELLSVDHTMRLYSESRAVARTLAKGYPQDQRFGNPEYWWRPTWFPIGQWNGEHHWIIDLKSCEVWQIFTEDPDGQVKPAYAALSDELDIYLEGMHSDRFRWTGSRWDFDFATLPLRWRVSGLW